MASIKERLIRLSEPVTETGCWLWLGATTPKGYGKITARTGVTEYAHRVSWECHNGKIPDDHHVCHKCDTPSCINPDHLFTGTSIENTMDKIRKGRHPYGEASTGSKLSESQVASIFMSKGTCDHLSSIFPVSRSTISLIRTGKRWKELTQGMKRRS